jgi:hypothetical protein
MLVGGFTFSPKTAGPIIKAMVQWAWLEVTEGWRSWFVPKMKQEQPTQSPAVQAAPGSM